MNYVNKCDHNEKTFLRPELERNYAQKVLLNFTSSSIIVFMIPYAGSVKKTRPF